ncbi:hypothetical protein SLEP1_g29658 [Rubroshorea leprosula]|uniref:Uncharacterized protein n=1 Tax=Rubroshorea leprosula TaxID=152421 RepID=A0AAV5JXM5_9ROSI|nr:hypothetical protein SLEP1_g29658 [Rubroshorea leprosula]
MTKGKGKNNKIGGGSPPKQRSVEEEIRHEKKIKKDRDYRANKKKRNELVKKFCDEKGITEELEAFLEKHEEEVEQQGKLCEAMGMASEALENEASQDEEIQKILKNPLKNLWTTLEENLESEMIQTVGLEGGTQIQMREATHDKEASTSSPAPPPHHELGLGSKQEVSVYDLLEQCVKLNDAKRRQQEVAAAAIDANRKFKEKKKEADNLNKQVKGLEEGFGKLKAELAEKSRISKDALDLQMINAVTLGWNLMKEVLQSMDIGSEFLNLRLLDTILRNPSLQYQFNEGLTLIGQGHPIDDNVAIQSDNPPVVVPRSFFQYYELLESDVAWETNVSAPPRDAANIAANGPQFQAANARANNVEQEDDANDQEDG